MKKINSTSNEKLGAYIVEYAMCKADMAMGTCTQAIYESPDAYPIFRYMCDTILCMAMGNQLVFAGDVMCDTIDMPEDVELETIHTQAPQVYECMLEYARMAQEFVYSRVINNIRVRIK